MIYSRLPDSVHLNRKDLVPFTNLSVSLKKVKKFCAEKKIVFNTIEVLASNKRGKLDNEGNIHKPVKHLIIDKKRINEVLEKFKKE